MILLNSELQSKYEQDRNSLRLFAQENPRDRLNIEIGDSKDGAIIQPQFKLLRFDNEYNLSVRLLHNEKEIPKIQTDGNRLIWQAGQTKIRFYEKEKSKELPDGGYEMEQIVNLQKSGNVFYYTLQTKGITFEPQPELTAQEIAQGCKRPDYIIGGYVLFANNNPVNFEGGKEYRAGKIGEIHAPIITDSAGRFAKCGLLISAERGLMRITVPDDFAVKAQNPCVLDPTIGYTTAGSSFREPGYLYYAGYIWTMGVNAGECTSITASVAIDYNTPVFKGMLLKASDLSIVLNGIGGQATPAASQSWKTSSFSTKPTMVAGTQYSIGIFTGNAAGDNLRLYYDAGSPGYGLMGQFDSWLSPITYTSLETNSNKYSVYCTYTAIASSAFFAFL